MPIGKGEGGGGAASFGGIISPQQGPPNSLAIADAATGQIVVQIGKPMVSGNYIYILQVTARVDMDATATGTAKSGPAWCELYLQRAGTIYSLLDHGYVQSGFARGQDAVVGIIGHVGVQPGDQLIANFANDSGASVTVRLEYFTHEHLPHAVPEMRETLSTKQTATFIYEAEPKNGSGVGSAAGDVTLTLAPAAGDTLILRRGWFQNLDAVNAYIIRAHTNEDGATDTKVYSNYISTTANGVSVAASGFQLISNATGPGLWVEPEMTSPLQFFFIVPALATGAQVRLALAFTITGRKPVVTLVSPTAGATAGAANVNTNKVI